MKTEEPKTEDGRTETPGTALILHPEPAVPELLPCPFCGEAAQHSDFKEDAEELGDWVFVAGCHNPACDAMPTTLGRTPAEAAQAWNTRKGGAA